MDSNQHADRSARKYRPGFMLLAAGGLMLTVFFPGGCASPLQKQPTIRKRPVSDPSATQLVRDLARPWGVNWIEVESVTLAMGLSGTGSDPSPGTERTMLVKEMNVREVQNPDKILASPDSALVMVRALIPPGAQEGDRIDIDVRIPKRSRTTSLQGGWAMLARMREYARLNKRLSQGHVLAQCQGDILVDSLIEGTDDPVLKTRGRILGGGVVSDSRELGLKIRDNHLSIKSSVAIGKAINRRFHIYANGERQGVAKPKTDKFISLALHPRYRSNLIRYIRVIENIPVRESGGKLSARLDELAASLLDPSTSSVAAVQLEAIGQDAVPVLRSGLQSENIEIQFYAAEAMAYLDEPESAAVLSEMIRAESAFRWRGFRALGAMDRLEAQEELAMLLHEDSAEIRYGAFRTLYDLSPGDPQIAGRSIGGKLRLHQVASEGSPLVHVAKSELPEVVIFGNDLELHFPVVLFAGKHIVARNTDDGRVRVRRLTANNTDEQRLVEPTLAAVIEAIVDVGGSYADVVQAISEARRNRVIEGKVAYSAIPQPGRKYERTSESNSDDSELKLADRLKLRPDGPAPIVGDASVSDAEPLREASRPVNGMGPPPTSPVPDATPAVLDAGESGPLEDPSTPAPVIPSISIVDDSVIGTASRGKQVLQEAAEARDPYGVSFDEDPDVIPAPVIDSIGPAVPGEF